MDIAQLESHVKYVTNAAGEKTEVIIPVQIWEALLKLMSPVVNGVHPIDENEPNANILADLKQSLKEAAAGQTYPIADLWTDIEA
jgi:hypothetical protein